MRFSRTLLSLLTVVVLAGTSTGQAQVVRVDSGAPAGGDGMSWALAFNNLQISMSLITLTEGFVN